MARPHDAPDVFRAIGHPVRRRMIEMLCRGALTAAELAEPFKMTQGAITDHLRTLRVSGLVTYRIRKNRHVYSLVNARLAPIVQWLGSLKRV